MPPQAVLDEIDRKADRKKFEEKLTDEGTAKFASHKQLLATIKEKCGALVGAR